MSQLSNQYSQLSKYLEHHQSLTKKKTPVKEKPQKKVEKKEVFDTKKLLEESKIHSYIPSDKFDVESKSLGFSAAKFNSMMRTKLIEEHKKLQSYERPYISVSELCNCIRQCYYVRMRYPVNLNKQYSYSQLYIIQKIGNAIHDIIQGLYDFTEVKLPRIASKEELTRFVGVSYVR